MKLFLNLDLSSEILVVDIQPVLLQKMKMIIVDFQKLHLLRNATGSSGKKVSSHRKKHQTQT